MPDVTRPTIKLDPLPSKLNQVFGIWHGGHSYSHSFDLSDMELFDSIRAAGDRLKDRRDHGHWQRQQFDFVTKAAERSLTPCVDETSYIDLFAGPESSEPFLRLEFSARGNVIRSSF